MNTWVVILVGALVAIAAGIIVVWLAFLWVTDRAIAHRQELDEIAANLGATTTNVHLVTPDEH